MAGFHFGRCPRRERVKFFQSSPSYLNYTAVSRFRKGRARRWSSDEPHPSSQRILTLASGHYGIYFTIFNKELHREDKGPGRYDANTIVLVFPKGDVLAIFPEFFISKAKQETQNNINEIQSVSRDLLSTWSLVKPRHVLQHFCASRHFSTSARDYKEYVEEPKIEELPQEKLEDTEESFESSFSRHQIDLIVSAYNNHQVPADLDVIMPLYQSLKRNSLALPSIAEYNIVLLSIANRQLSSEMDVVSIESKLTTLLTVYQDILHECYKNPRCKPNTETFEIVLSTVFEGASNTVKLGSAHNICKEVYQAALIKSQEFCQVGINLYMSLQSKDDIDADIFFKDMLTCVELYPQLLTQQLVQHLIKTSDVSFNDGEVYAGLLRVSKHFGEITGMSKEEHYKYVSAVFDQFKELAAAEPEIGSAEYQVYSALLESLVPMGNLPVATRFLDQVLSDYKELLELTPEKSGSSQMQNISSLVSKYIETIMASGKPEDLNVAYNLLQSFKKVTFIPELTVGVYNEMINLFINRYSAQEMEKINSSDKDTISAAQVVTYNKVWELYNHCAIRKDFHSSLVELSKVTWHGKKVNCKDLLLSLSLDLGDHANVARLVKEILLKDHLIGDWNISRKLFQYLYNGAVAYESSYYVDLAWNVFNQQATHYQSNSKDLNSYVSETIGYLLISSEPSFSKTLNSTVLFNAFAGFALADDNIYGLMLVSLFLAAQCQERTMSSTELFKVLHYQACLINKFEDPENHYLQLSDSLLEFKHSLVQSFASLIAMSPPEFCLSEEMQQTCDSLGVLSLLSGDAKLSNNVYYLDLTSLLTANYTTGVSEFLEYFKLGYNFNSATWSLVLNRNFVIDFLENERLISTSALTAKLLEADPEIVNPTDSICRLVALGNDKVLLRLLNYLIANKNDAVLQQNAVLGAFVNQLNRSDNKQLHSTFFSYVMENVNLQGSKEWLTKYLLNLNARGCSQSCMDLLEKDFDNVVSNLDLGRKSDSEFLYAVLNVVSDQKNRKLGTLIIRRFFAGVEGNKALLKSERLLEAVLNFYIAIGSHDVVLKKFSALQSRSPQLQHSIYFAQLISSLSGGSDRYQSSSHMESSEVLALALLKEDSLLNMDSLFGQHKSLVNNKEDFFQSMVAYLTKAASLTSTLHDKRVLEKFESLVKLCKPLHIKKISVDTLITIVRFLATVKSKDLLNIIFNKFMNNNRISHTFNFYFLQVEVENSRNATRLLEEFKRALTEANDEVNLHMLHEYECVAA